MNKKKIIGIALIIFIFLALCGTIVYVIVELKDEKDIIINKVEVTDAIKFKNEYESLNGITTDDDITYRSVNIPEDNPIKYITANDLINKMNSNESFIVYFGFDTCPWCRTIIEDLINSAKEKNISLIYYVDIKNIRDKYELNENNEATRTVEGTDGYYGLLNKLGSVLDDYPPLTYTESTWKESSN